MSANKELRWPMIREALFKLREREQFSRSMALGWIRASTNAEPSDTTKTELVQLANAIADAEYTWGESIEEFSQALLIVIETLCAFDSEVRYGLEKEEAKHGR